MLISAKNLIYILPFYKSSFIKNVDVEILKKLLGYYFENVYTTVGKSLSCFSLHGRVIVLNWCFLLIAWQM